jgi:hypothetical protein
MINKSIKFSALSFSLLFLFIPSLSHANLTGKDILEDCQVKIKQQASKAETIPSSEAFQVGACTGYIKGLDDMEIIYASIIAGPSGSEKEVKKYSLYCLPAGTTNNQMAHVIVNYIKDHPDELTADANIVAVKAFRNAFPCPKSEK